MNKRISTWLDILAARVKTRRLNQNLTQKELATMTGLSLNAIKGAEKGECNLKTFVMVLDALGLGHTIEQWVPEQLPSPVQSTQQNTTRVRARKTKSQSPETEVDW